jgi:hypothetical protein
MKWEVCPDRVARRSDVVSSRLPCTRSRNGRFKVRGNIPCQKSTYVWAPVRPRGGASRLRHGAVVVLELRHRGGNNTELGLIDLAKMDVHARRFKSGSEDRKRVK